MTAASTMTGLFIDAASQPTKSGFNPTILIFAVIGGAFYFLIYRPQQKKQKAARELGNSFDVGDEVVTAGGIVGRVLDIADDRITLETSVGASFVVLRPYILRKIEPVVPPTDVVDGSSDDDHDDGHDDDQPVPPATPPSEGGDAPPPADDPDGPASPGPTAPH